MALVLLQLCLLIISTAFAQDPCDSTLRLGNLAQRVIGYILATGEVSLSDYRLAEGWYVLPDGFTLATKPQACGTYYNWWIQDALPTIGTIKVKLCQNDGADDCAMDKTISVKKCSKGYAYELTPPDSALEAYCIENLGPAKPNDAPDISTLKPTISVEVLQETIPKPPNIKNSLQFFCDFNLPDDTYKKLFYDVEWNLHSGMSKLSSLLLIENADYESKAKFNAKTKLTEDDLRNNLVLKLGFTLSCTILARKSLIGDASRTVDSPPKFFGVEIITPPLLRVEKDETIKIQFKLTVPFGCLEPGCSLDWEMLVVDEKSPNCLLSDLVQTHPVAGRNCGFKFEKVDEIAEFTVAATFGTAIATPQSRVYNLVFSTPKRFLHHNFMENNQLPPIKVELLVDQTELQNKECFSISDPHMMTFDQTPYENQVQGTFVMYRHKELEAEVQTKTKLCFNINGRRPYCNCGVAVRAGRDIFEIDNCDRIKPPRFVQCKDTVLKKQITRKNNIFEVSLPHGTKVKMIVDRYGLVNVHISPSLVDVKKSEGLCGFFDNHKGNDQQPRKRSALTFSESWRVEPKEDLFNTMNHLKMQRWSEELFLCDCSNTKGTLLSGTQCSSERKCKVNPRKIVNNDMCDFILRRKKRDAHGILFDGYTDPTTVYVPSKHVNDIALRQRRDLKHHSVNKRQAPYTDATARVECLKMMNTTTFQKCNTIPHFDVDSFVENCVLDAVMTNSMDWTMQHVESIKETCIDHVEVMQPLPPDVRAELVVLPDRNTTDDNNGTIEYPTLPPLNEFSNPNIITPELLTDIKDVSCPNECQGHGECIKGTCQCDEPYTNFDCSIDKTQPPIMIGIPDSGECDLQNRRCAKTSVFVQNIAETDTLTCRIKRFEIDNNHTIHDADSTDVPGHYESMYEVYCPLSESRRRRSVTADTINERISYGYHTSISNDGNTFSDEDTVIIYDSMCVNCTKIGSNIICTKEDGYCLNDGRCFSPGETSGCYICSDYGDEWISGPDCPSPIEDNGLKDWMIGLISAAVAVVVLSGAGAACYYWKRIASRKRVGDSMTSLQRVNKTSK
ncbi:hypothetical protein ACF0H5_024391 [Mactra antiquata]